VLPDAIQRDRRCEIDAEIDDQRSIALAAQSESHPIGGLQGIIRQQPGIAREVRVPCKEKADHRQQSERHGGGWRQDA
jgi:hypothetical protein